MKRATVQSHSISAWLSGRRFYLKSPLYMSCEDHVWEHFWVSFDVSVGLHEAANFPLLPFEKATDECYSYLAKACKILKRNNPKWSPDDVARRVILDQLGPPPLNAYTIYMLTVSDLKSDSERVVYIGKTNSNSNRFRGGHAAISKLHAPEYAHLTKSIYFGCIVAMNDDENYIPIDWLSPNLGRDEILSDIEYQLIYHLQPELNEQGKLTYSAKNRVPLTIENHHSNFLDATSFD